jgi:hypothetical protein
LLALGRGEEARKRFEALLASANDVGLMPSRCERTAPFSATSPRPSLISDCCKRRWCSTSMMRTGSRAYAGPMRTGRSGAPKPVPLSR